MGICSITNDAQLPERDSVKGERRERKVILVPRELHQHMYNAGSDLPEFDGSDVNGLRDLDLHH